MKKQFVATIKTEYLYGILLFNNVLKHGDIEQIKACYNDLILPIERHLFEEAHKSGITNDMIADGLLNL